MDIKTKFRLIIFLTQLWIYRCVDLDWHFIGTNVAFNKTTQQYPGLSSGGFAYKAVDGNTNSNYLTGRSCSHTDASEDTSPWWKVTFDRPYNITGVIIYNRRDCCSERIQKFKLLDDSNQTIYENDETVPETSCGKTEHRNKTICQAKIECSIAEPRYTSSLTVTIPKNNVNENRTSVLTLCEVKAIAGSCMASSVANGTLSPPTSTDMWQNVTLLCEEGFRANNNIFHCVYSANATTLNETPVCTRVFCDFPGDPINGYYTTNNVTYENGSLEYGAVILSRCYPEYEVGDLGNNTRTCLANGTWGGQEKTCRKLQYDVQSTQTSVIIGTAFGSALLIVGSTVAAACFIFKRHQAGKSNTSIIYEKPVPCSNGNSDNAYAELTVNQGMGGIQHVHCYKNIGT